jgi:hypothetical protein
MEHSERLDRLFLRYEKPARRTLVIFPGHKRIRRRKVPAVRTMAVMHRPDDSMQRSLQLAVVHIQIAFVRYSAHVNTPSEPDCDDDQRHVGEKNNTDNCPPNNTLQIHQDTFNSARNLARQQQNAMRDRTANEGIPFSIDLGFLIRTWLDVSDEPVPGDHSAFCSLRMTGIKSALEILPH